MILCTMKRGGSGTPVDELDRCCQVHDNYYGDALEHHACCTIFTSPYINNNECEMLICECDRKADECFARSTYNNEHYNLPGDRCHWKLLQLIEHRIHSHTRHTHH
ncbi:acidic phospholipase A2 1-like [Platichthys flesus]|uniref:acidic phospholipase A2 1-like n=1 Tax=Platichthys flesus TaxID=8260 RepID=UPI002DBFA7F7|nr:acidic phospholipase A2 1-like [Platichthys flesus]